MFAHTILAVFACVVYLVDFITMLSCMVFKDTNLSEEDNLFKVVTDSFAAD